MPAVVTGVFETANRCYFWFRHCFAVYCSSRPASYFVTVVAEQKEVSNYLPELSSTPSADRRLSPQNAVLYSKSWCGSVWNHQTLQVITSSFQGPSHCKMKHFATKDNPFLVGCESHTHTKGSEKKPTFAQMCRFLEGLYKRILTHKH